MKDAEDEAFDELAKRQGHWGGGYQAKRAMAADKLQEDQINYGTSWSKNGERIDPTSVYKEPAQEPVTTVTSESGNPDITMSWWHEPPLPVGTPLYTYPPQRPWVGLTDEERQDIALEVPMDAVFITEAKLKEKNG
jgi:hypothetical protein